MITILSLKTEFVKPFVGESEFDCIAPYVKVAHDVLRSGTGVGNNFLGWLDLPFNYDKAEFEAIKDCAEKIRKSCDVFVVIGIGGSYLGSRAVIEYLKSPLYNNLKNGGPQIYFAGCNISSTALSELLTLCDGKDVCVNVISKSGTTTEPAVAFRIFRSLLEKKYGRDGARDRIFVTTDRKKGALKAFADSEGYRTFVIRDDVGGRFSVLSAVGLLPIAVAGIDVDSLMAGAAAAHEEYDDPDVRTNDCYKYAVIRNIMLRKGKTVEILVGYEPYELMFNEWWKQLFGESEGKNNKGLYPSSVIFSTDLHSLGQYIQDGMRTMFETVVWVKNSGCKVEIPNDSDNIDGLNFLSGRNLDDVNRLAMLGTLFAHVDGGVPNVLIEIENRSEFSLGYMIYFFELACAISGYLLGVNPFDQPGVEAYKKNMFALLGKPGYEEQKKKLEERM